LARAGRARPERFLSHRYPGEQQHGRDPASVQLDIVDPPKSARNAYPIATFAYMIVPANAPQRSLLDEWLSYVLGAGQAFRPTRLSAPKRHQRLTVTFLDQAPSAGDTGYLGFASFGGTWLGVGGSGQLVR
jgi:hypothetical protein